MSRHFDRHISLSVSRKLIEGPVSPNMMTIVSSLLGLAGAGCFSAGTRPGDLAGAALIWLHSVLDGCDGELARIRMQESPFGGLIDFWGDNLVHLALFAALAVGQQKALGSNTPLILGAAAAAGVFGSAVLAFWQKRRRKPDEALLPQSDRLSRLENILAQRDFIYLLMIMAYWRATYYFLWAGAIGAPLFFLGMLAAIKHKSADLRAQNA
jgi:phosphatidylglycerophosphate synthase